MTDTIIHTATDSRYVVYRGRHGKSEERLTITKSARGARSAHTQRYRKGEFEGYDEYGWYLEELVGGHWRQV